MRSASRLPLLLFLLLAAALCHGQPSVTLWQHGVMTQSGKVEFSPDGKSFLQTDSSTASVFDSETGALKALFSRASYAQNDFRFLGNNAVVFWTKDKGIWKFDIATGQRTLLTTQYNSFGISIVTPSPDGKWLAIQGGWGGQTLLHNLETGQQGATILEGERPTWATNSQTLIYPGPRIYKTDGTVVKQLTAPDFSEKAYVRATNDGTIFQFLNSSHLIRRYSDKGVLLGSKTCNLINGGQQLYLSPDGLHMAYWGLDEVVLHQALFPFAEEGRVKTPNYRPETFGFNATNGDFYVGANRIEGGISIGYANLLRYRLTFAPFTSTEINVLGGNRWLMECPKVMIDDYLGQGPSVYLVADYYKARPQWVRRLSDGNVVGSFDEENPRIFSADGKYMLKDGLRVTETGQSIPVTGVSTVGVMGRNNRFIVYLNDYRFEVRERKGLRLQTVRTGVKSEAKFNDAASMVAYVSPDGKYVTVQKISDGAILGKVPVPTAPSGQSQIADYWITKQNYLAVHTNPFYFGTSPEGGHRVTLYKFSAAGNPSVVRQFDQPGATTVDVGGRVVSACVSPDGEWVMMATNLPPTAAEADPAGNIVTRLRFCRVTDGLTVSEEAHLDFGAGIAKMGFTQDSTRIFLDLAYRSMATITARAVLKGFILDKTATDAGQSGTGSLTLSIPAGPGGVVVHLTSSKTFVSVPPTVTVPEGSKTVTFPYTTSTVKKPLSAGIVATYDSLVLMDRITVRP